MSTGFFAVCGTEIGGFRRSFGLFRGIWSSFGKTLLIQIGSCTVIVSASYIVDFMTF